MWLWEADGLRGPVALSRSSLDSRITKVGVSGSGHRPTCSLPFLIRANGKACQSFREWLPAASFDWEAGDDAASAERATPNPGAPALRALTRAAGRATVRDTRPGWFHVVHAYGVSRGLRVIGQAAAEVFVESRGDHGKQR